MTDLNDCFLSRLSDYKGHHWTHNKYRHNGKWTAMPKDITIDGKPALRIGKDIIPLPGIVSLTLDCTAVVLRRKYGSQKRWERNHPQPIHPIGMSYSYQSDKHVINTAEQIEPEPEQAPAPTAIIAPITTAVPIQSEPMTYRQSRYLYILTKRNYKRDVFTKSQASALITELTGKE